MASLYLIFFVAFAPFCLAAPIEDSIIFPCDLKDYACIGDVMSNNSNCTTPVPGSIARRFIIPYSFFEAPYFNSTITETNVVVRNLNRCFVSKFYINPGSDTAVLSVDCPKLDIAADRTHFLHRTFLEDDVHRYNIRGVYPLVRITITMPASNMDLRAANVWSEVLVLPKLTVQSLERKKSDREVTSNVFKYLLTNPQVFETEAIDPRGLYMSRRFVQLMLCDYKFFLINA